MTSKTILLIDDDDLFLMLTRKLLQGQDYLERIDTVETAKGAQAYFDELKEKGAPFPHVVFIDLDLQHTNGLELAEQLHAAYLKDQPSTKLIILSSSISQRDRQAAEGLSAVTDYMEKPLSPEKLRYALGLETKQYGDRTYLKGDIEQEKGKKTDG